MSDQTLSSWLPLEQLQLICSHTFLDQSGDFSGFLRHLNDALQYIPRTRRLARGLKLFNLPSVASIYSDSPVGVRCIFRIPVGQFVGILNQLHKTWVPFVNRVQDIPSSMVAAFIRSGITLSSVFSNLQDNNLTIFRRCAFSLVVLPNVLIFWTRFSESEIPPVTENIELQPGAQFPIYPGCFRGALAASMDADQDEYPSSVITDTVERIVSPTVLKSLIASEGCVIKCPSSEEIDSFALSSLVFFLAVESHAFLISHLKKAESKFFWRTHECRLGCCSISPSYERTSLKLRDSIEEFQPRSPRWVGRISGSHLTVGPPSVEGIYKRVVDLLNNVERVIQSESRRHYSIPARAERNFDPQCECCNLVKNIYNSVVYWAHGEFYKLERMLIQFPNHENQKSPISLEEPEFVCPTKKIEIQQICQGLRLGTLLQGALSYCKSIRNTIQHQWLLRLESGSWSSQNVQILVALTHDKKLLTSSGSILDVDNSILFTRPVFSGEARPGSPSLTETLDSHSRAYVFPLEQVMDVRFSVAMLKLMLEECGLKLEPCYYTISRSGRNVILIVPGETNYLITCGLIPVLATFRYVTFVNNQPNCKKNPIVWTSSSTQAIRNFYHPRDGMMLFSLHWIERMIFNKRAAKQSDFFLSLEDSGFSQYRLLPNLLQLLTEQEIVDYLCLPYKHADYWMQRVHLNPNRLYRKKTHSFDDTTANQEFDSVTQNSETPPAKTKHADRRTVFFAVTRPNFYTALRAFLLRKKARILVSLDALRAIWFALRKNPVLWNSYRELAGILCELRVPPQADPRGQFSAQPPLWVEWVNSRKILTQHCVGEQIICKSCERLSRPKLYSKSPLEGGEFVLQEVPPFPASDSDFERKLAYMDEYSYFSNHEAVQFFPAAYRKTTTRQCIPDDYILLPGKSQVYIGCNTEEILESLYAFASDPEIASPIRKRVFLGIHSTGKNHLVQPSSRPKDGNANFFLSGFLKLEKLPPDRWVNEIRKTRGMMTTFVNDRYWMSAFHKYCHNSFEPEESCSSNVPGLLPTAALNSVLRDRSFSRHESFNCHATDRFLFFMTAIEAMFFLDYTIPGGDTPISLGPPLSNSGTPLPNHSYQNKRQRHQLTRECVIALTSQNMRGYLRMPNVPIPCGYRSAAVKPDLKPEEKKATSNLFERCYHDSCFPLWSSPLSEPEDGPKPADSVYRGELLPFRGSHEFFLPLVTAYQAVAIGGEPIA